MPLIDGTYEILEQRPTGDGRTLVRATDPDGRPVRIVWYDVPPEAEASFERYRRTLRKLARAEDVLLREVVSRPGARYAVWEDPDTLVPAALEGDWRRRLDEMGLDPTGADLRRNGRELVLTGLDWSDDPEPPEGAGLDDAAANAGRSHPVVRLPALGPSTRSWLATALLLLSAAALALTGWVRYANDDATTVPDVVGRPADEAVASLDATGFAVEARSVRGEGAEWTVVAVDPPSGAALRPGRTVRIDYLRPLAGASDREVPALDGRPLAEGSARLEEAGLTLGAIARVAAATPAGTVLAQRPAAGSRAAEATAVDLLVSDGPTSPTTFVPDLVGRTIEEARALARLAGLPADRILVDPVRSDDVPAGRVVAMTPAAWHPVPLDAITVRLLVSEPDRAFPTGHSQDGGTPDLIGLDAGAARIAAAAAGLDIQERIVRHATLPSGVVLQQPEPGDPLDGPMRIVLNARPAPLPTPTPEVVIQAPRLRWVPYRFLVEPGIPEQRAELRATTAERDTFLVLVQSVEGGDTIDGVWGTVVPGPVRFELTLNGLPYADAIVTREVEGP